MRPHPDDFELLRHASGDRAGDERRTVVAHLQACRPCREVLGRVSKLDGELKDLAASGRFSGYAESSDFALDDPFRTRPRPLRRSKGQNARSRAAAEEALIALKASRSTRQQIKTAAAEGRSEKLLAKLTLKSGSDRLALLHAMQDSGREISSGPAIALALARAAIRWLRTSADASTRSSAAELIVPWPVLWGFAYTLAAQAHLWTKDYGRASASLRIAYRAFGRAGDETGLALVESIEAQRRSFAHEGATGLRLARRAEVTQQELGLDDAAARSITVQGLALASLGRQEDAIACYRKALPVFERHELWSNYVGAVNSLASAFNRLGRFEEARKEYARALRRFSPDRHWAWTPYLRAGLAESLFAAGRFREAAIAFARAERMFTDTGLRALALLMALPEVESWARHGDAGRARRRLELFRADVSRPPALDRSFLVELAKALSASSLDLEKLTELRQRLEGSVRSA